MRRALALAGLVLGTVVATAPAAHATTPWDDGTVFVAAQGARYNDGGLFFVVPGSNLRHVLASGTTEDVAVTANGNVYWTTCGGQVFKYDPVAITVTQLHSGFNCATGIAIESNGDILVSDFYHLYLLSPTGALISTLLTNTEARSIAVDRSNNIYLIDATDNLEVWPAGAAAPVQLRGTPYQGQYTSVRLGANSTLVLGLSGSPGGVLVLPLGGGSVGNKTIGASAYGAVSDQHGNLYAGDLVGNVNTIDQLDEFPAGGTSAVTLSNGFDQPEGLAVWPPVAPAARSGSTTTLTTTSSTTVAAYQPVSLKAAVSSSGGAVTGLVQFAVGGQPLGAAVPVSNGVARLSTTLPKGSDSVTATYAGSSSRQPSQSSALSFTVNPVSTKTVLTTSDPLANPDGSTVDVTAQVTSNHGIPDGYVEFFVNGSLIGGSDVDGSGATTQPITVQGLHTNVRAVYDGSPEFDRSTSNTLAFTATTPYLPTLTTNVQYGAYRQDGTEKITITAKVAGYSGAPRPSGTISADNGFTCTALKNGSNATTAVSTCTAFLFSGSYDVTTSYSGDATYAAATTDNSIYPGG